MFLCLADSHMTGVPFDPGWPFEGLDRPLEGRLRPGLAQPPPRTGDGLRDKDIAAVLGVPEKQNQKENEPDPLVSVSVS